MYAVLHPLDIRLYYPPEGGYNTKILDIFQNYLLGYPTGHLTHSVLTLLYQAVLPHYSLRILLNNDRYLIKLTFYSNISASAQWSR